MYCFRCVQNFHVKYTGFNLINCFKAPCGSGWISDGSYCYYYSSTSLSWSAARSECQRVGADLVTIKSYTQSAFIISRILEPYWIGATDASVEGMKYLLKIEVSALQHFSVV